MSVLPKNFLILGAGVLTARMGGKLRKKDQSLPAQKKALARLVKSLAGTEQGRTFGITAGTTPTAFAKLVPLQAHSQDFTRLLTRTWTRIKTGS